MVDQITASFPAKKIKVVRSEDYLGEKDANAIYCKYGATAIHDCINNATEIPLKAVKKLSDVKSVNLERLEHIATGIYGLDKIIGGLYMGQVTVITGKRGDGKSTLASQMMTATLILSLSILESYQTITSSAGSTCKSQAESILMRLSIFMEITLMTSQTTWSIR